MSRLSASSWVATVQTAFTAEKKDSSSVMASGLAPSLAASWLTAVR